MPKNILNKKVISVPEAMEMLLQREQKAEPSYLQRVAMEHAMSFSRVVPLAARYLVAKLMADYKLSMEAAMTLVNIYPELSEELEMALQAINVNLADATIRDIMELIEPYRNSPEDYVKELIEKEGGAVPEEASLVTNLEETKIKWKEQAEAEERARLEEEMLKPEAEDFSYGDDEFDKFMEQEGEADNGQSEEGLAEEE